MPVQCTDADGTPKTALGSKLVTHN